MSRSGAAFAATAAILYGTAYVATAFALESFTPLTIAGWRGLVAAALLVLVLSLPVARGIRPGPPARGGVVRLVILGLVGGAAFTVAMNVAVSQAGATVTAFVAGLYAVIAAVLAIPLLGERIERTTMLALVAALAGTVLLSDLSGSGGSVGGVATALVAALAFGTYLVLSRRWAGPYRLDGPLVGTTTMAISGAVTLSAAALVGDPLIPAEPSANALVAMGWLSIGPGAAAAVLVVAGMKRLEARYASLFLLLNPPTAALLAVLLLDERLEPLQVVGAACVLLAIAGASGVWRQAKGRPT